MSDDADDMDEDALPTPQQEREALEWFVSDWIARDVLPLLAECPDYAREELRHGARDLAEEGWEDFEGVTAPPVFVAILGEAEDLLRAGEVAEAARRLRLLTSPKWKSTPHCVAAYAAHRGIVYGPHPFVPPVVRDLFGDIIP